ncbi:UNVERIFIED_CONTAM: hypothetical protein RMT77_018064 [Armadillidium vulgare]
MKANKPLYLVLICVLVVCSLGENKKDAKGGKILFKNYSTKTKTLLSFFTSTVPFTCFTVAANAVACTGRRRRNLSLPIDLDIGDSNPEDELSSGIVDPKLTDLSPAAKKGKFQLTIWSTISSTLTITTYITNQHVTLSVSAQCTVGGVILPKC